jgi:hypothetical protein
MYKFDNVYELIHDHVLPKWQNYLSFKSEKTNKYSNEKSRTDTIWKKIIRDVREFFRALFRMRFHYLDYKDNIGAKN